MRVFKLKRILLPLLVILNLGFLMIFLGVKQAPAKISLQTLAKNILTICQKSSAKPSCYDSEIPKLMNSISMEEAFQVTRLVQDTDTSYSFCHVLGHNLAAEEVKKDPDKWKEVIARCPSGMCSNGCLHGGFQERFRSESLEPNQVTQVVEELKTACEKKPNWKPTGLEQASCYHALGHLGMYLTKADIDKSLAICDAIAVKSDGRNFTKVCYDGTFMQIFQPLEPEDFALVKGKQPTLASIDAFCQKYTGQANATCVGESWPLFASKLVSDPQASIQFCAKVEPGFTKACYDGLFYILTIQLQFDDSRIIGYCSQLPSPQQGYCFAGASDRMIETDYKFISRAVKLCGQASLEEAKDYCFDQMISHSSFNFHSGSAEKQTLCNSLPTEWTGKCLASG